jgi:predicted dienelactone hydrolase
MAYGIVHFFPGGTKEQYEASILAVHPSRDRLPQGQIFHAAGPSAGGWTITVVHQSKKDWEHFRDDTLMPALTKGVDGGFVEQPQETTFEIYNLKP